MCLKVWLQLKGERLKMFGSGMSRGDGWVGGEGRGRSFNPGHEQEKGAARGEAWAERLGLPQVRLCAQLATDHPHSPGFSPSCVFPSEGMCP